MNTAWVVEFQEAPGYWVPFDIEWSRSEARNTMKKRQEHSAPKDDFRVRKWERVVLS